MALQSLLTICLFYLLSKIGFHLSGIVWTYTPNGVTTSSSTSTSSTSASNYGTNSNSSNSANAFGGPALPNGGAAGAAGAAVNNGNNNLIGNQQALQPHPMRLSSTERDSSSNGANYPLDENKKYNVSVSFDR